MLGISPVKAKVRGGGGANKVVVAQWAKEHADAEDWNGEFVVEDLVLDAEAARAAIVGNESTNSLSDSELAILEELLERAYFLE